ncbi:hypothetical protein Hypma_001116 [Hypsizygus marmoreus]|uniref:Uncharacterized protein n=1 Tax=Hypsizygus marmoreus TaxID=39966 RepID=A0A369JDH1_HYPMA|nr:hypothetical protein Hypma_001116 [Hypsizygus marmoreus]
MATVTHSTPAQSRAGHVRTGHSKPVLVFLKTPAINVHLNACTFQVGLQAFVTESPHRGWWKDEPVDLERRGESERPWIVIAAEARP